jgi:hypothetical protein
MDLELAKKMAESNGKNKRLTLEEREDRKRKREEAKAERLIKTLDPPAPTVKTATVGANSFFICQFSGVQVSRCFQIPVKGKDDAIEGKGCFANPSCALSWIRTTQKEPTAKYYESSIKGLLELPDIAPAADPKHLDFLGGLISSKTYLEGMKHDRQWKAIDAMPDVHCALEVNTYLAVKAYHRNSKAKAFKKPKLMALDTNDNKLTPLDATDLEGFLLALPLEPEKYKNSICPDHDPKDVPLLRNAASPADFGKLVVVCRSDKGNEQEVREFKKWAKTVNQMDDQ